MSIKITKEDLKKDQVQVELQKGFKWTANHFKAVTALVALFIVIGAGLGLAGMFSHKKETQSQEKYYLLERAVSDKQRNFQEAQAQKNAQNGPSGDLAKDYGDLVSQLESFAKEHSKTQGGQMAAITLVNIYKEYKQWDLALALLESLSKDLDPSETMGALLFTQWGNILAEKNDCTTALTHWEKVVSQKAVGFAHGELKVRMGLCYEALKDFDKAEIMYAEVVKSQETNNDFSAAKDAEKYLKLMKAKRNLLGSGS